jgi:hypothetical protein
VNVPAEPTQSLAARAALTIFEMQNLRGYIVPEFNFHYEERGTGVHWLITCGGDQAYVMQCGEHEEASRDQVTGSHFMIHRVVSALLMSRAGLFNPITRGRILFKGSDNFDWSAQTFLELTYSEEIKRVHAGFTETNFLGWLGVICDHTFLRRAIDDTVLALRVPTEAFIYLYRGFEWLEDGLKISKKEMAAAIGVEVKHFKELGRMANDFDSAVRHASRTGVKTRADLVTYSTWICGLIDGINYGRKKIERDFTRLIPLSQLPPTHSGVAPAD